MPDSGIVTRTVQARSRTRRVMPHVRDRKTQGRARRRRRHVRVPGTDGPLASPRSPSTSATPSPAVPSPRRRPTSLPSPPPRTSSHTRPGSAPPLSASVVAAVRDYLNHNQPQDDEQPCWLHHAVDLRHLGTPDRRRTRQRRGALVAERTPGRGARGQGRLRPRQASSAWTARTSTAGATVKMFSRRDAGDADVRGQCLRLRTADPDRPGERSRDAGRPGAAYNTDNNTRTF